MASHLTLYEKKEGEEKSRFFLPRDSKVLNVMFVLLGFRSFACVALAWASVLSCE